MKNLGIGVVGVALFATVLGAAPAVAAAIPLVPDTTTGEQPSGRPIDDWSPSGSARSLNTGSDILKCTQIPGCMGG